MLYMVLDLIKGEAFSFLDFFAYVIATLAIVMLVLPLHEVAHGFAADKLGDPTARHMGRLTLNPFAHIDWLGAAFIMLFGFGWAKPVPVNMRNFNKPKRDMALTALAGPLSNLVAAFIGMFLCFFSYLFIPLITNDIVYYILSFVVSVFEFFTTVNITLAVFNLIPFPPLDGSRLLAAFLPDRIYYRLMQYERYLHIALLALIATDALDPIISFATNGIYNLFFDFFLFVFDLYVKLFN